MSGFSELHPAITLIVLALMLCSAALAFIGACGLLQLGNFYQRLHAPTLSTTLGMFCMLLAAAIFFFFSLGQIVWAIFLVGAFITVSTPVTLTLLARTALARDRIANTGNVPPPPKD